MAEPIHQQQTEDLTQDQDPTIKMSEPEQPQTQQPDTKPPPPPQPLASFSLWPPTQRKRDTIISRIIETLSTPSVLNKRYGTLSPEEASEEAKRIEAEAFSWAGDSVSSDDDGMEVLQVYSKKICKLMLETVKNRSGSDESPDKGSESGGLDLNDVASGEEVESEKTET